MLTSTTPITGARSPLYLNGEARFWCEQADRVRPRDELLATALYIVANVVEAGLCTEFEPVPEFRFPGPHVTCPTCHGERQLRVEGARWYRVDCPLCQGLGEYPQQFCSAVTTTTTTNAPEAAA